MLKTQVFNPYMPSYEYVPDGEPHVFGDRIYVYGSHDRFDGAEFCLNDYICYSADVKDICNWRYEGIIYRKEQDPRNQNIPEHVPPKPPKMGVIPKGPDALNPPGIHAMWAPDVVKGPDGRFYLYYCLDYLPEVAVAVCDSPAGSYEFLGFVKHGDGTLLGQREGDLIQFDPGIFIDDDGTIYLYSGNAPMRKDIYDARKGSQVMKLCPDMLTLKEEPKALMPDIHHGEGTGYEGHEFFEASSIRKIQGRYYFVYSSVQSHELCYAVSDRPDGGYRFGGTIVDIADIFLNGRTEEEAVNCTGNTHGGIECINGRWYVFYHRQTNQTNFSRQGCAEEIHFEPDGHIRQVEVTSCGLNQGPLTGCGMYPAYIACHLTRNGKAVHSNPHIMKDEYPYLTQDLKDQEPTEERNAEDALSPIQYIANIQDGSRIGYKYFEFLNTGAVSLRLRGQASGRMEVSLEPNGDVLAAIPIEINSGDWTEIRGSVSVPDGVSALYLTYRGSGRLDFNAFTWERL